MREIEQWRPSKFVTYRGRLRASRDASEVGIGSRLIADRIAAFYEEQVPLNVRGRLLDLGCGKAPLYGLYSAHASSVTRVDWGTMHGTAHVDVEHDLNDPLPFADGSYETVILSDVLEHIRDPFSCLKEMHRVLSPGGKAIINVPFLYWLHEQPHDYYRYTRFGLEYLAQEAGFKVLSVTPVGGAPAVMLDMLGKLLAPYRVFRPIVRLLPRAYDAAMRFGRIRRYSARTADLFPLAYGMVVEHDHRPAS